MYPLTFPDIKTKYTGQTGEDKFRSSGVYPLTFVNIKMKYAGQTGEDKFRSSGVYPLMSVDIKMKYTGQTGRYFETRLKEHLLSFKKNNYNSKLSQNLLETANTFSKIYDILGIVYFDNKWTHLNRVGKLYIYKEALMENQLNNKHTDTCNKISETVLNREGHLTRVP